MVESFGGVLRSVREALGMSLQALADRVHCSKSALANYETDMRMPDASIAAECDRALGTAPLLTTLLELDGKGDKMRRRALVQTVMAATTLVGIDGARAVADLVRHGLMDSSGVPEDWDEVVARYSRRLVTDPSADFGQSLVTQLAIIRQQTIDHGTTRDRLRVSANLNLLYGLWLGNQAAIADARNWYRTAQVLASRSGDTATNVWARARAASRGIYEGYTVQETIDEADAALALSGKPSPGMVEAYAALVHVHALTGNQAAGRRAVAGMRDAASALPAAPDGPLTRAVSFDNYLECRVGTRATAEIVHAEALSALKSVPVMLTDAKVYYGLALVRDGDIKSGVMYALQAVQSMPHSVRVVGIGVADLLSKVPRKYKSDDLAELTTYAAAGARPWENLS